MIVLVYYIPQSILASFLKYKGVYRSYIFLSIACQMAVLNIRCNIGTHDLVYIGCLKPKNTGYQVTVIHTYQANYLCVCSNYSAMWEVLDW